MVLRWYIFVFFCFSHFSWKKDWNKKCRTPSLWIGNLSQAILKGSFIEFNVNFSGKLQRVTEKYFISYRINNLLQFMHHAVFSNVYQHQYLKLKYYGYYTVVYLCKSISYTIRLPYNKLPRIELSFVRNCLYHRIQN